MCITRMDVLQIHAYESMRFLFTIYLLIVFYLLFLFIVFILSPLSMTHNSPESHEPRFTIFRNHL